VSQGELEAAPEFRAVSSVLQRRPMPRPVNC
jgi:hypothetical protein